MDFVEKALFEAGFDSDKINKIPDENTAIEYALSIAQKKDLVCIMSGSVEQVIPQLYSFQEKGEGVA